MNTSNLTSNPLKRFGKGLIGLIAIQLVLVVIFFVIQSCQKNELFNINKENASENFIKTVSNGIDNLNTLKLVNKTGLKKSDLKKVGVIQDETAIVSMYSTSGRTISENIDLSGISTFQQIMDFDNTEVGVTYSDGRTTNNISDDQELIANYSISVENAKTALQPTLSEAKNYLYSKGYTDADIQYLLAADEEGPAMSEADLIPAVMSLIAEEQKTNSLTLNQRIPNLFVTSAYASQIGSCVGDALGISLIVETVAGGLNTKIGKALLKKAIRKVAARTLGWVGAAIFVYEFGDCMDWW